MGRKARDKKPRLPADLPAAPLAAPDAAETRSRPAESLRPRPPSRPPSHRPAALAWPPNFWLWSIALTAAAFAAYLGGLDTPFLLDDPINITKNPRIQRPLDMFELLADSRAVVTASLRWNYLAGGFAVTGYHVLNIAAHAITGVLVFALSWMTLRLPVFGDRYAPSAQFLAATVALVFLVHPMQTESVTYVIQRAEIFVSAGLVAALIALASMHTAVTRGSMAMLVAGCVLGVYSKPSFAVVPVLLAVYDVCFLGRGRIREMQRRFSAYAMATGAAILTFVLTKNSGSFEADTAGFDMAGITPLDYLSAQFGVVVQYLRVALWPDDLCFDCGYRGPWPVLAGPLGDSIILPFATLFALGVASLPAWKRHPLVPFAVFGSAVVLSPTSSFVPLADFYVEHRMYLPIAFLAMALVPAVHDALGAVGSRLSLAAPALRAARAAAAVAVVAALAASTVARNRLLADPVALMEDALAQAPQNERVQYNLANAYKRLGRDEDAIAHYKEAIRLIPNVIRSYQNLGSLYLEQGKVEEALRVFEAGAKAKPEAGMAHRNLANTYLRLNRNEEALAAAEKAVAVDPVHPNGHRIRGDVLKKLGRRAEAAEAYRAGVKANPRDATLRERLAELESR